MQYKRLIKDISIIFLIVTALLGCIEGFTRLYFSVTQDHSHEAKMNYHAPWNGQFAYGRLNYLYYNNNDAVRINHSGFRGPDYTVTKPENTLRIMVFGGSSTFGVSNIYEGTYPFLLEQEIRKYYQGKINIEVINCGSPGFSTGDILRLWKERKLFAYSPDIIIYSGWNDLHGMAYYKPGSEEKERELQRIIAGRLNQMRKKSALLEKLISTIEEKKSDTIDPLEYASRAEQAVQDNFSAITSYEDNLRKIIKEIPLPNNKKLFVRFPGLIRKNAGEEEKKLVDQNPQYKPYSYYQVNSFAPILQEAAFSILEKLCKEYQVGIIDVVSDFEKLPAEDHVKCFTDILHLKDKGNYHVAQSIFKALLRNNLL